MSYREFAYYYDQLMKDMPYAEWIHFAEQCWERLGNPKTIVDLGCGTGNLSIPLAEKGLNVTGIDLSTDMLAVAREKMERTISRSPGNVKGSALWIEQDIREWELPTKVDSVISFCDCFNYILEEAEIIQSFSRVYEGLVPGGSFIFDVHTPYQLERYAEEQPFVWNEDNLAYIWTCDLDRNRQEIEHDLTIFAEEPKLKAYRKIEEVHIQRAYSLDWLKSALKQAGFREIRCYADFTFGQPGDNTERAFFMAVK